MASVVKTPAFCTQCRSRCGCLAVVQEGKLTSIEPLPGHPSGEKLCPKGKAAPELVYHPDRLTRPLRRTSPKGQLPATWQPIGWDVALDEIGRRMGAVRNSTGAEQVAFSVTTPSGTHISDSISWIERFIRAFGSPNTIYSTEICNWHKDFATRFTYGSDIGTPDFANTDCILLWGHNPTATWLARSVEIHKGLRRGAKLIVVDPRPTMFARKADCWLQVRPGADQALALAIAHVLISDGAFDHSFVGEWTNGAFLVRADNGRFLRQSELMGDGSADILVAVSRDSDSLLRYECSNRQWRDDCTAAVLMADVTVDGLEGPIACRSAFNLFAQIARDAYEQVEQLTGIAAVDVSHVANLIAEADSIAYFAWNGVSQSTTATQTDRAISVLYSLTGSYGMQGGNVPGTAASFGDISGRDLISRDQKCKALGLEKRPLGPPASGWVTARDVYRAITTKQPYSVRMLFSFGGNLLASQPDTELAKEALEQLEFHVHADFFLNASALYADIVLPVATSWEREGLRCGFDSSLEGQRRVQLRPAVIEPVGQARSDTDIVIALARHLGLSDVMFNCDVDAGHDQQLASAGLSVAHLREQTEGVTLSSKVTYEAHMQLGEDGSSTGFATPTGRIEVYSEQLLEHGYDPIPVLQTIQPEEGNELFSLQLSCAKTVSFCHSQHRNIASLRQLMPDPMVEISLEIAESLEISGRDWIKVRTPTGEFVARAKIVEGLAVNTVFSQHGWTIPLQEDRDRSCSSANMNQAISTALADPISGSIPLRSFDCEIEKLHGSGF